MREPELCDDCGERVGYYDPSLPEGEKIVLTRKCACTRDREERSTMPDNKWGWTYKQYPLWQFRWCRHCGERIEMKRTGSGRILRDHRHKPKREWGTGRILRDYTYKEVGAEHACQGAEREKEALRKSNVALAKWMNRVVADL